MSMEPDTSLDETAALNNALLATEGTPKPLEKAHDQVLRLITGGIKSKPTDAMLLVAGRTTICSLIKEKSLILYGKLLTIPTDKFFCKYENRPRHLKAQSGLIKKAIELKKALQIDDKPKSLSLPMNPLEYTDVVCCNQLLDFFRKSNTPPKQMLSLSLETINVNYPGDQWLQVFTDGSYTENQANVGAGVYSELFSFYAAAGHNRSAFEGEIEAIRIALRQLCCLDTKFTKAVMLSDSQSAINSIGNREPPKTAEIKECRKLYELLREKNKTVVLQWIPGHCGIKDNGLADTLAKKGTKILQCMDRPMSFHTMKTLTRREFMTSRCNGLKVRTKGKQWTVALTDISDWPRIEAVAELDWPRIEAVAEFRVALYHIAEWPRIEAVAEFRLWPRIEAVAEFRLRTVTRLPRIEAVAEFRLLGQESKPLLSLDYVLEKQWTVALSDIPD
ncbi:unnamed protein product [Rodentolepis nana]|uniref:ribonuclease H n=1 Tax=Rodentolepis nana TaxID=102285 RepID=A0A0R3TAH2_RODNA|nr:unnamed protein product [Rodentolepis nana]